MEKENLLGIFSWFGFVQPFVDRITMIQEAGFTATSLWWENEEEPFPMKKEKMPEWVRERGLYLENIHVPFNDSNALWSENEFLRKTAVRQHMEWLNDCHRFGIPMMVMHLTEGDNPPAMNRQGLKSMDEIVNAAEKWGVTVALENTRRTVHVLYVLQNIASPVLGFCFDSSHHYLANHEDFQLLENYGERLVATHLSDNDGLRDQHWLPGHGVIDWAKLAKAFPPSYTGCFTLEAYPTAEERQGSPQDFLEKAYRSVADFRKLAIK